MMYDDWKSTEETEQLSISEKVDSMMQQLTEEDVEQLEKSIGNKIDSLLDEELYELLRSGA
jgi:hypothetical protein